MTKTHAFSQTPLYPLRFEPIYQYRTWGGRRLADLLSAPLPKNDPFGEAWILSDSDVHRSQIANGTLKGRTHQSIDGAVSGMEYVENYGPKMFN